METNVVLSEELSVALLNSSGDAIIAADAQGLIRFWNPGAERIFGFSVAEAVGQSLDLIIPERLRERHWQGYHQVMQSGKSQYGQGDLLAVPGMRKGGTRISLEFTIVALRGPDARMDGVAAILRDVTPRFEELRSLRKKLTSLAQSVAPTPRNELT